MGHHLFATSCRGSTIFMIYILLYSVELCKCSYIIFDLLEKFQGFLIDITNLEMQLFTQLLNSIVESHVLVSSGNYLACYTLHWEVTPSPNTSSPNCLPQMSSVCVTCVYSLYTSHYFFSQLHFDLFMHLLHLFSKCFCIIATFLLNWQIY